MRDLDILKIGARAKAYDFAEKLAPIYKLLNWEWYKLGHEVGVPNREEIHEELLRLINIINDNNEFVSSGGLVVEKIWDEDSVIGISLKMEIDTDVYIDELKGD
jgi:hypothetical protein